MPALDGQSVSTITDATGAAAAVVVVFWDPVTGLLRDDDYATVQDGVKHGAVIVDNPTSQAVTVRLAGTNRSFSIPARGRALTVAQLDASPIMSSPPAHSDVQGFTFELP